MKSNRSILTAIIISATCAALAFAMTGCTQLNSALTKTRDVFLVQKPGPVITNEIPVYAPEDIEVAAVTNFNTGIIAPAIPKAGAKNLGYVQVGIQTPSFWESGPNVAGAQAIANTVPGYGGVASFGILALASLSKLYLNRKQKPIITSTFQTVDDWANAAIATGDPKAIALANSLKEALAKAHDYADVAPAVQALINAYTGTTSTAKSVVSAVAADNK